MTKNRFRSVVESGKLNIYVKKEKFTRQESW